MDLSLITNVRVIGTENFASGPSGLETNNRADLLVAQSLPLESELVRMGESYLVRSAAAIASVVAEPTTAVTLAIQNLEPDGGKSLLIGDVFALFTVNTAAALVHAGIIGQLSQARQAAQADSGLVHRRLNGMGQATPATRTITFISGTVLPANYGWFPIGKSVNSTVNALPGFQIEEKVYGKIIVPPGGIFALHTLASHITISAMMGFSYHRVQLDLGP